MRITFLMIGRRHQPTHNNKRIHTKNLHTDTHTLSHTSEGHTHRESPASRLSGESIRISSHPVTAACKNGNNFNTTLNKKKAGNNNKHGFGYQRIAYRLQQVSILKPQTKEEKVGRTCAAVKQQKHEHTLIRLTQQIPDRNHID